MAWVIFFFVVVPLVHALMTTKRNAWIISSASTASATKQIFHLSRDETPFHPKQNAWINMNEWNDNDNKN